VTCKLSRFDEKLKQAHYLIWVSMRPALHKAYRKSPPEAAALIALHVFSVSVMIIFAIVVFVSEEKNRENAVALEEDETVTCNYHPQDAEYFSGWMPHYDIRSFNIMFKGLMTIKA
jgi:hypothetical protein